MTEHLDLKAAIFTVDDASFQALALKIFRWQAQHNPLYRSYVQHLGISIANVQSIHTIPFLPISFFKQHLIKSGSLPTQIRFSSSGTTGMQPSYHHLVDVDLYRQSFQGAFSQFYGDIQDYVLLALLPSYLERQGSSLVFMVDELIKDTQREASGFYLNDLKKLAKQIHQLEAKGQKTLLLGVSYALWDFAEQFPMPLQHTVIMETGGMKGRRKEIIREELHAIIGKAFQLTPIHSEYGMTELLSQAYSIGQSLFRSPPWMRVLIREVNDPFHYLVEGQTGAVNIIDLANLYSCAFIATNDLGKCYGDGSFSILGRMDHSDMRGCNLLV